MKVVPDTDLKPVGIGNSFWEHNNLTDKLSIQLERSSGSGGGQREGNVNWATHLLEKLGGSPGTTGQASGGGSSNTNLVIPSNEECGIRDVWNHNLHEEFRTIRHVVQKYTFVAMDTEFPGVVARPIGEFRSTADYQYQLLRCNVDLLRIIQLGLTFLDDSGKTPPGYTTWQFNFKFNLSEDMYAQDSIDLLQNSGIQFKKHEEDGIDPFEFAALLMTSGVVLMDNIKWLSFHSGYDFGYLLKLLTDSNLPQDEGEFFELLRLYFPVVYDVKYLMKSCKNLKGGLQEVADQLELQRVGPQHQAGSDSLLTGMAFFKMREMFFEDNIDDQKYCGHLYGLGTSFVVNGNTFHDNGDNSSSS
ncbi:CCR4-NOT transcription complex subunit 7 [Macrosteles quadrilineatus]|uniref:CCR4-NOT transcription complex subunit 7 n=1 Tax=Macrosteles quadrilineatus TaxID=74068 RepID=UPI0023E097C6|nr:CCR4-NOT transcription complex subunit 7 [Macrosteles quadrilineatus]XP_054269292.1 CCR4-NOT transcription complex subunit 7 [Macrosteles quadrilineatus]